MMKGKRKSKESKKGMKCQTTEFGAATDDYFQHQLIGRHLENDHYKAQGYLFK